MFGSSHFNHKPESAIVFLKEYIDASETMTDTQNAVMAIIDIQRLLNVYNKDTKFTLIELRNFVVRLDQQAERHVEGTNINPNAVHNGNNRFIEYIDNLREIYNEERDVETKSIMTKILTNANLI